MESIKCTVNGCSCICYSPVRTQLRICSSCQHGWVAHAMDKIGQRSSSQMTLSSIAAPPLHSGPSSSSVDPSQANCLFDVASLILFGAEAVPTRLKILLDRLFLHLQRDLILQVLGSFGWSYEDYCRGYRIQDSSGHVLDKWTMATSEEELVILDQFQRFTETKSIAEEWLSTGQRNSKIHTLHNHPLEGHGSSSSSMDVKQLLLNGSVSRANDIEASRHLFSSGAYLSSLLPRYPSLYNPFLAGPGIPGSVGHLSQASVLPYLLARSPMRSLPKPMDFRMEPVECVRNNSNPAINQGSPAKRNGKVVHDLAEMTVGKEEARQVKTEATEERNSFSSNETNFQSTDDDEPIDYSTKDDRVVPDLSKTHSSSSMTTPRNPSVAGSPGDNQSSTSFPDQDLKQQQPRKSSTLVKKPYQPTPGYGGTLISPNGKKRVLCTACLKTFCDKGALKIHYSAVHLKELHMCTIDGCTMTFSSRRSRNRHSANPNPKLHFGQTGRRRLHNNSLTSGSPFKEGHETTLCSSPPQSPRSRDGSPSVASDGEFQLCPRSQDRLDRCYDGSANQKPMLEDDEDDDDEEGDGPRFPPTDAEGRDESQGSNTEDEEKTKKEEEDTSQEPPRFFHGTSKRKSAMPTRCSIPPTEDSASDFQALDLDSSDRKRRRLINDHVHAVSDDSENIDGRHQVAFDKRSNGNGKTVDLETAVVANEEHRNEELIRSSAETLTKSVDEEAIVDLSRPSLARSLSNQSSETSAADSEVMMRNGKPFLSRPERQRDSEDRDSACGCCEVESGSKGIEGFQRQFQAGPVDARSDLHGGGLRSIHVCKVQGCNASFPSKRSRDRHSANANLHRRLFYSDSIDHQTWIKEGIDAGETGPLGINMAPIDERKKSLDTALNLTTNATDQMETDDIQRQPEDIDSTLEERVEISDAHLKETQMPTEVYEETDDFPDESTMTDQLDRSYSGEAFRGSAANLCAKNFSVRKNRNLLSINENLHNHLLVNSTPASAQLAV